MSWVGVSGMELGLEIFSTGGIVHVCPCYDGMTGVLPQNELLPTGSLFASDLIQLVSLETT